MRTRPIHHLVLALTLLVWSTTPALSQVVVNLSGWPMSAGTAITYESADGVVPIDPGPAGADRTWNFSAITTELSIIGYYVDPATAPGGPDYPTATVCQEIQAAGYSMYMFYRLDAAGMTLLGGSYWLDPPGTLMLLQMEASGPLMVDPITYGSMWTVSTTRYDMEGAINNVDVDDWHVDAWGTLTDVTGTFDCLRIQRHRVTTHYDEGVPGETDERWTYLRVAPDWGEICSVDSPDGFPSPDFTEGEFGRVTGTELPAVGESSWSAIKSLY